MKTISIRPNPKALAFFASSLLLLGLAAAQAHAGGLVLWNKLGSPDEILQSAYGPNLQFYSGGTWPDVTGVPGYGPGVFGNALTIGAGGYGVYDRVHNVVWNQVNQYLSPDKGTIAVWFKQLSNPVGYQNGVYRIFDGDYGLGPGLALQSLPAGLTLTAQFGGGASTVQYNVSPLNGTWVHLAAVWDRNGIDGSADKLRLYVNGQVAGYDTSAAWGNTVGAQADIAGANDYNIVGQFYVDNLQVYDYAVTDFSRRFEETPVPEPASVTLAALGTLALAWRQRSRRL